MMGHTMLLTLKLARGSKGWIYVVEGKTSRAGFEAFKSDLEHSIP